MSTSRNPVIWQEVSPHPGLSIRTRYAPAGTIWVCRACGKTAVDAFGEANGWDESCALNARLCHNPKVTPL